MFKKVIRYVLIKRVKNNIGPINSYLTLKNSLVMLMISFPSGTGGHRSRVVSSVSSKLFRVDGPGFKS